MSKNVQRRVQRTLAKDGIANRIERKMPSWFSAAIGLTLAILIVLTINYRNFSDLNRERLENEALNSQIKESMIENVSLQEEIHYLRNDLSTVEKKVKKFGMVPGTSRTEEMISKPAK